LCNSIFIDVLGIGVYFVSTVHASVRIAHEAKTINIGYIKMKRKNETATIAREQQNN